MSVVELWSRILRKFSNRSMSRQGDGYEHEETSSGPRYGDQSCTSCEEMGSLPDMLTSWRFIGPHFLHNTNHGAFPSMMTSSHHTFGFAYADTTNGLTNPYPMILTIESRATLPNFPFLVSFEGSSRFGTLKLDWFDSTEDNMTDSLSQEFFNEFKESKLSIFSIFSYGNRRFDF